MNVSMDSTVQALASLRGKIALVTGGCDHFGAEIAAGLAEAGEQVIITSRDPERAKTAAAKFGDEAESVEITSEPSVDEVFDRINKRWGRLDILVNNAGGHSPEACGLLEKESLAGWKTFIDTNLTGTFLMLRAYARLMMDKNCGGSVINIASISSLVGRDRTVYPAGMTPNPFAYTWRLAYQEPFFARIETRYQQTKAKTFEIGT